MLPEPHGTGGDVRAARRRAAAGDGTGLGKRGASVPGFPIAVALAGVFQLGVFLSESSTLVLPVHPTVVAFLLAIAAVALVASSWRGGLPVRRFVALFLVWCAALGVFIPFLASVEVPLDARLLSIAAILAHGVAAATLLLWVVRLPRLVEGSLAVASLAVALLIVESVLQTRMSRLEPGPTWAGPLWSDSELGLRMPPHSQHRSYYPDNPRGYFEEDTPRATPWIMDTGIDRAELVEAEIDPARVEIRIHETKARDPIAVEVSQAGLPIRAGARYRLRFRATADHPRSITYAVSQAYDPWDGFGFYLHDSAEITPEPRTFEATFLATESTANARIHFNVGPDPGQVSVTEVVLEEAGVGRRIEPPDAKRFFVRYEVNRFGCRDRDYEVPRPPGVRRILVLGDSYVLGLGVHRQDLITSHLERLLNEAGAGTGGERYEVINCGVSGYSTRDERLFYERLAAYEPQIVLLGMVANDDRSFVEDLTRGDFYVPGRADHVSALWATVRQVRSRPPPPSFEGSLAEVLQLDDAVRARGGRLAVFVFRNFLLNSSAGELMWGRAWPDLVSTMRAGLEGTDIPFIDVGDDLLAEHSEHDLMVHRLDVHPNEIGHALAAGAVYRMLIQSRLVP